MFYEWRVTDWSFWTSILGQKRRQSLNGMGRGHQEGLKGTWIFIREGKEWSFEKNTVEEGASEAVLASGSLLLQQLLAAVLSSCAKSAANSSQQFVYLPSNFQNPSMNWRFKNPTHNLNFRSEILFICARINLFGWGQNSCAL